MYQISAWAACIKPVHGQHVSNQCMATCIKSLLTHSTTPYSLFSLFHSQTKPNLNHNLSMQSHMCAILSAPSQHQILSSSNQMQHQHITMVVHYFSFPIIAHPGTSLSYGSEFRPSSQLLFIFHDHLSWPKLLSTITKGRFYKLLQPCMPQDCLANLQHVREYGNHKSASSEAGIQLANKLIHDDAIHQWAIPILPSHIDELVG